MGESPKTNRELIVYRLDETNLKIDDAKNALQKSIDGINQKLDNTFATKDYVDNKYIDHEKRLSDLESDRQWLIRTVIGILIAGIISFFYFRSKG